MTPPRLVLIEPENPENFGRIIRLCAALGAELHVVEPCGFPFDEKRIRRGALDYIEHVRLVRHTSWPAFMTARGNGRLLLATTHASHSLYRTEFAEGDWILLGRESAGAPEDVHRAADLRFRIPMQPGLRSLNLSLAAAMVLGEAVRQSALDAE